MWQMRFQKVSTWDIAYAVDISIACLITYWLTAFLIPYMGRPATPVGILWALISTVFVYKDTRDNSLSAGISRLVATFISFAVLVLSFAVPDYFFRHGGFDCDRHANHDVTGPA